MSAQELIPPPREVVYNAVQDVIFFGPSRPVLLRFHVQVDGRPYEAAWNEYVEDLFKYCDTDGDGVLTKNERIPSSQMMFSGPFFGGPVGAATPAAIDRNPQDGRITLDELTTYYRRSEAGPFQVQFAQGQVAVADSVFVLLDADKDSKLSKAELAAASGAFLKLDLDDDEVLTTQELVPGQDPFGYQFLPQQRPGGRQVQQSPFLLVRKGEALASWILEFKSHYVAPARRLQDRVGRDDTSLNRKGFDRLDANKDGSITDEEIGKFAEQQADLELLISLGKRTDGKAILELRGGAVAENVRKTDKGIHILDLGEVQMGLQAPEMSQGGRAFAANQAAYKEELVRQFKQADTDKNNYLELDEVKRNPTFANSFAMMDRDGDGKLYEKEMLASFEKQFEFQAKAAVSRVSLAALDQGRGLFEMLDTNRDGRLGLRELRGIPAKLAAFDKDGDGLVSTTEIPRTYQLTLSQGQANFGGFPGQVVVARPGAAPQPPRPAAGPGPIWFHKMDRNRDGDVSLREFLGTREDFQRIDKDADGLISSDEAQQMDGETRKGPQP